MKLSREVKIGMLVVTAFLILLWGMNFLKGRDLFFSGNKYYGVYSRVDGLTDASPIYYKGYKIGTVRDIEIHPTNPKKFLVTFTITEKVAFPDNTVAELYSLDIMGAKAIQIKPGDSNRSLTPGDTLLSTFRTDFVDQMSDQMIPLKEKAENLIVRLDSSLLKAGAFLDADTKKYFDASIRDLSITMNNMAEISTQLKSQIQQGGDIDRIIENVKNLMVLLDSKKAPIGQAIDNLSAISQSLKEAQLDQSIHKLDSTLTELQSTLQGLNNGEGTIGMALKDEALYNNMTQTTETLNKLLVDFKSNPKRYLSFSAISFGKKVSLEEEINQGILFYLQLTTSETQLNITGKEAISGYKIKEEIIGNTYSYWCGTFNHYNDAQTALQNISQDYPDAVIYAKENGKNITLEKAIRKTK